MPHPESRRSYPAPAPQALTAAYQTRRHSPEEHPVTPTINRRPFQFGDQTVTLETGEIARQADGAVIVNMDDTVVLVTVVIDKKRQPRAGLPAR